MGTLALTSGGQQMLGLGELLHSQLILLGLLWDGPVPPPRTLFSDLGRTLRSRGAWLMPSVIPTCPPLPFSVVGTQKPSFSVQWKSEMFERTSTLLEFS